MPNENDTRVDTKADSNDSPTASKNEPYRVEVDSDGCDVCNAGKTWTIVGPDDYAIGQSFYDEEEAEDLARLLNGAHEYALSTVSP